MADTYTAITVHYVFSTKNRAPIIADTFRERLWAFMGGVARKNAMKALGIGGTADHVHLLVSIPPSLSVAKGVQQIKGASSAWVHQTFPDLAHFAWQAGYGAFSVSASQIGEILDYIKNQEKHHRGKTFQDEYRAFLGRHAIAYEEKYLWD